MRCLFKQKWFSGKEFDFTSRGACECSSCLSGLYPHSLSVLTSGCSWQRASPITCPHHLPNQPKPGRDQLAGKQGGAKQS